jgi:adenosylcobinamide-GDP ribazoletransferase
MGASTAFYPAVGLLLGLLLAVADALLGYLLPVATRSALILALWVVITGALHLDGFLDACDGLLGGFTPQARLEIMRDERRGAYALAGGTLLLLLQYSALNDLGELRWAALLLAPVLGRWGMTLAIVFFPYARPTGLGKDVKEHSTLRQAALASLFALLVTAFVSWALLSLAGLLAWVAAALALWAITRFTLRRIPGLTGDIYGALNILIETTVLLVFVAARGI